jgi:hypothetical protein
MLVFEACTIKPFKVVIVAKSENAREFATSNLV